MLTTKPSPTGSEMAREACARTLDESDVRRLACCGGSRRPDCTAGHVGLELANVILRMPLKMLGEFSLDYGTFWDQRLFARELRRRRYAGRRAYCDDLQQALPCGLGCVERHR